MTSLNPIDHMFLGPVYRSKSAEVRAAVDRLLGIEPGHRDSSQIVVGYCRAGGEIRDQIDNLLQIRPRDGGYEIL
ncbi:MAG: hypothetical protein ABIE70_13660 [bacterium]